MLFNVGVKFLTGRMSSLRSLSENGVLRSVVDTDGRFPLFSFWLKLRCLKMWKASLASIPNKRSNPFSVFSLGLITQRKSLDYEENPVHWGVENCSTLPGFPSGISSHQQLCWSDPSSHYAAPERLLAFLGAQDWALPWQETEAYSKGYRQSKLLV